MKISACIQIPQDADPEVFKAVEQMRFQKLMEEAVSKMEPPDAIMSSTIMAVLPSIFDGPKNL